MKAAQQKQEQAEQMRGELLQKVLAPDALERLNRIKLVKSDKARQLEDMVLNMAGQNQIQAQITDSYLKQMLEGISDGGETKTTGVSFDRRRFGDDDDSDVDLDGL